LRNIHHLNNGLGLMNEQGPPYFISLIFVDFHHFTLKKFHTIEYPSVVREVFVDKADLTVLILEDHNNNARSMRICKIVDKTIVIGDLVEIDFYPQAFYGGNIYGLKWCDRDGRRLDVRIYMSS
jgi:hypothetical protein